MRTTNEASPVPTNVTSGEGPSESGTEPSRGRQPEQARQAGEPPLIHQQRRSKSLPPDLKKASWRTNPEGPMHVATFDSSNGGLVATNTIKRALDNIFGPDEVRLVPVLDHGNAPYGGIPKEERGTKLVGLVRNGLSVAERAELDAVIMACNTACTAFKNSDGDKQGIDLGRIPVPVHDLIANTARDVAAFGGKMPVILSTEATAKDDMYENRIKAAAKALKKEEPTVVRIGAGDEENRPGQDWANMINNLRHLSRDEGDQQQVTAEINRYLTPKTVPEDATSLYLCCTHYPVFKEQIERRLAEIGRGHVPVIDPMQVQVRSFLKQYWVTETFNDKWREDILKLDGAPEVNAKIREASGKEAWRPDVAKFKNKKADRSNRQSSTKPIVVTSGTSQSVKRSVNRLLETKPSAVMYDMKFEVTTTGDALRGALNEPERSDTPSSDTSRVSDASQATQNTDAATQPGQPGHRPRSKSF